MTDERILLQDGDDAIIQRGRGPEIQGTRITVYDIVDYQRMGWTAKCEAIAGVASRSLVRTSACNAGGMSAGDPT